MEVIKERKKNKFDLGLTCSKYMLFVLNAVFAVSVFKLQTTMTKTEAKGPAITSTIDI